MAAVFKSLRSRVAEFSPPAEICGSPQFWNELVKIIEFQRSPHVKVPWSEAATVEGTQLLLEDVVDQDLKEDEENDDDTVALLQEGAALRPAGWSTPQHTDAPADTHGSVTWQPHDAHDADRITTFSPVDVLLRLLYGFNGTLKFAEVCSFFPQTTVVFTFVSCSNTLNALFCHIVKSSNRTSWAGVSNVRPTGRNVADRGFNLARD